MIRAGHRLAVLLVSVEPDAHAAVLESFRQMGARVDVARSAQSVLTRLRHRPDLVLVDLAFGAALTSAVVSALNTGRGPWVVVALHHGALEHAGAVAAELEVDGFCRPSDLAAAFEDAPSAAFATSALAH